MNDSEIAWNRLCLLVSCDKCQEQLRRSRFNHMDPQAVINWNIDLSYASKGFHLHD